MLCPPLYVCIIYIQNLTNKNNIKQLRATTNNINIAFKPNKSIGGIFSALKTEIPTKKTE